jgi:hypothetical protein
MPMPMHVSISRLVVHKNNSLLSFLVLFGVFNLEQTSSSIVAEIKYIVLILEL